MKAFEFEKKIVDFVKKNIVWFFLVFATFAGIIMRYNGMKYASADYNFHLRIWWDEISVSGLSNQVGDYNIPYQTIIFILVHLPFNSLVSYKLLSIFFDIILSVSSALFVYELSHHSKIKASFAYVAVFCSLNVVFNSAYWAQCDSIYSCFIVLSLYFLFKNKNTLSFIFLGIAFAFKLQTVFIFPFFVFHYFNTQKYSVLNFLIIPVIDIIMCLPTIVFFKRSFADIWRVYVNQTVEYKELSINFPNLYVFFGKVITYEDFAFLAIALTFLILVAFFSFLIIKNFDFYRIENFLAIAVWSVWTVILFLPSMHERYSYLLDILCIISAFVLLKKGYVFLAIFCNFASLRGICKFLFCSDFIDINIMALIYLSAYVIFTLKLLYNYNKPVKEKELSV